MFSFPAVPSLRESRIHASHPKALDMKPQAPIGCLLILLAAAPARGDTLLCWKLKEGQVLAYSATLKSVTGTNVNHVDTRGEQTLAVEGTWTVSAVGPDGCAQIVQKLDRIRLDLIVPGAGDLHYDSKDGKPPAGPLGAMLEPVLAAFLKGSVALRVAPSGKVTDVKLSEDLAKTVKANPDAAGVIDEESARRMAESFPSFPDEPVKTGAEWERVTTLPPPPADLEAVQKFTYEGVEKKDGKELHKLAIRSSFRIAPGKAKEGSGVVLLPGEAAGKAYFDADLGRFEEVATSQTLRVRIGGVNGGKSYDTTTDTTTLTRLTQK